MSGEFGVSTIGSRSRPRGLQRASGRTSRRRLGRLLGAAALAALCLLGLAAQAQAATQNLYASPSGSGGCSSPADACSITTAVTNANAASTTDNVRINLAEGTYSLSAPSPTALPVTFAGPSLAFLPESGTPTLSGTNTVRVLSVGATSNVTIEGLRIEAGFSAGSGGGIENAGRLTVRNSTFAGNTGSNGGGIANIAGASLAVENSTFSGNTATSVGGGAIIAFGPAAVERSTIVGNTAPINGGGINVQSGGVVTVSSSTFANNTSGSLGGALSNLGTLNVEASTIAGNTGTAGSAIATGNANVKFAADIIAAQTSGQACSPVNAAFTDGGYNLDVDGTCVSPTTAGTGSHSGQTEYGSSTYGAVLEAYLADGLADNGGPTQTIALLKEPSPATSLADPAFAVVPASFGLPVPIGGVSTACSLADQRNLPRRDPCDVGAFEIQPTPPPAPAPAPPAPIEKPAITALKIKPKKLHNGQKATISFTLDVGAKVTFQLKRRVHKKGKVKLVKSGGAPKAFTAPAGNVKRTWKPKGLALGGYQLQATPAGGTVQTFNFKIVAKKRR